MRYRERGGLGSVVIRRAIGLCVELMRFYITPDGLRHSRVLA